MERQMWYLGVIIVVSAVLIDTLLVSVIGHRTWVEKEGICPTIITHAIVNRR